MFRNHPGSNLTWTGNCWNTRITAHSGASFSSPWTDTETCPLPNRHLQGRLRFPAAHMDKPNGFWRKVWWSDGSRSKGEDFKRKDSVRLWGMVVVASWSGLSVVQVQEEHLNILINSYTVEAWTQLGVPIGRWSQAHVWIKKANIQLLKADCKCTWFSATKVEGRLWVWQGFLAQGVRSLQGNRRLTEGVMWCNVDAVLVWSGADRAGCEGVPV